MTTRFLVHLFIISFLLNFVWEISQMIFFADFGMGSLADYGNFLKIHWIVSLKDAAMIIILYIAVALINRNWHWGRHFTKKRLLSLLFLGAVWAIGIEYYHVILNHNWAYNNLMPLLPVINVGVLPVLQMLILPAFAVFLSRKSLFLN